MSTLDLSRVLVAEEVVRARAEGWSGVLALTQGEVAKGLYFVEGAVVFAASTVEEDRLGACLFRAGKITEAQFRAAMRESEATGRPLGHTFVGLGYVTPQDLAQGVVAQAERIVLSVLRWTTGALQREPMERPLPADLVLDLDTHRLLLLGTRQFPDAGRLERALGPEDRRLRRVAPPPFDYEAAGPLPAERAVLASCARSIRLGELLALPHPRPEVARAAYALLVGGLIDDAPARVPAAPPPRPAPGEEDYTPPPLPPQTPEEAERLARSFLEKGFRERAIAILQEALVRHPEAPGIPRLLALTRGREGGFDPAVERLFLTVLENAPQDSELRHALASYYRRAGMVPRAILQLRLVLSADSGHAGAWRDLGELEAGETRRS